MGILSPCLATLACYLTTALLLLLLLLFIPLTRFLIAKKKGLFMCFFPFVNNDRKGLAFQRGVTEFECGACPECLAKRARSWALRCSMEAKKHLHACMITLTYDTYVHDERGNVIGERVSDLTVCKGDAQKFIKRLRRHLETNAAKTFDNQQRDKLLKDCRLYGKALKKSVERVFKHEFAQMRKTESYKEERLKFVEENAPKIKYMLTAEYGKRTHRAHYHAIIFGYDFPDSQYYKKSKRGNVIYRSEELTRVWGKGICTVDTRNINAKVARYCTKYCAKDTRVDDTFMLFSRCIGDDVLMSEFNGVSYWMDGREYPIPKRIWKKQLLLKKSQQMANINRFITDKYKSMVVCEKNAIFSSDITSVQLFEENRKARKRLSNLLNKQRNYIDYLSYWERKTERYNAERGSVQERIIALPNEKYFAYKNAALYCLNKRKKQTYYCDESFEVAPRSGCISRWQRFLHKHLPLPLVIKGQMTQKFDIMRLYLRECKPLLGQISIKDYLFEKNLHITY